MDLSFFTQQNEFSAFTWEHWAPVIVLFIIGLAIIVYANKRLNSYQNWKLLFYLSLMPLICCSMYVIVNLYHGEFNYREDLPIHVCRFLAVASPVAILYQHRFTLGVFYFWIMVGTLNAVLTPDLEFGYPHWTYWVYWLMHVGLIILPLFYVNNLQVKIQLRDIKNAFWMANLYLLLSLGLNLLLGSNYMYSLEKPPSATILDYMGDWPIYLFSVQILGLVLFIIAYAPMYILRKFKSYK